MAANLATINGEIAMAYQGETPWHHRGTRLPSITSVEQALKAAHLDWTVRCESLYLKDGRLVDIRKAIVRDGDNVVLGTVGPVYTPIQNASGLSILNDICRNHGVTIESAGALGLGERIWALAKLPVVSEIVPGDLVNNYVLVSQTHDGSGALFAKLTGIRVVCQNTIEAATGAGSGANLINIRHTVTAAKRIDLARHIVDQLVQFVKDRDALALRMLQKTLTTKDVAAFINHVLGIDETKVKLEKGCALDARRRTIAELVYNGTGADLAGSTDTSTTAWAVVNAVCEYFDHVRPAEAKSPSAVIRANESALFGSAADLKLAAWNEARQLLAA